MRKLAIGYLAGLWILTLILLACADVTATAPFSGHYRLKTVDGMEMPYQYFVADDGFTLEARTGFIDLSPRDGTFVDVLDVRIILPSTQWRLASDTTRGEYLTRGDSVVFFSGGYRWTGHVSGRTLTVVWGPNVWGYAR